MKVKKPTVRVWSDGNACAAMGHLTLGVFVGLTLTFVYAVYPTIWTRNQTVSALCFPDPSNVTSSDTICTSSRQTVSRVCAVYDFVCASVTDYDAQETFATRVPWKWASSFADPRQPLPMPIEGLYWNKLAKILQNASDGDVWWIWTTYMILLTIVFLVCVQCFIAAGSVNPFASVEIVMTETVAVNPALVWSEAADEVVKHCNDRHIRIVGNGYFLYFFKERLTADGLHGTRVWDRLNDWEDDWYTHKRLIVGRFPELESQPTYITKIKEHLRKKKQLDDYASAASFSNGIYSFPEHAFYPYDATEPSPSTRSLAYLADTVFEPDASCLVKTGFPESEAGRCPPACPDPMSIPTPSTDRWLKAHGITCGVYKWFVVLVGRLLSKSGNYIDVWFPVVVFQDAPKSFMDTFWSLLEGFVDSPNSKIIRINNLNPWDTRRMDQFRKDDWMCNCIITTNVDAAKDLQWYELKSQVVRFVCCNPASAESTPTKQEVLKERSRFLQKAAQAYLSESHKNGSAVIGRLVPISLRIC